MSVRCRLEGGPFDGDRGQLTGHAGPPAELFVIACTEERCGSSGVHWYLTRPPAEKYARSRNGMGEVELYLYGRRDRLGTHVYIYGELTTEGYDRLAGEKVAATA